MPEENTLKGLQLNWLLKAGVIKLRIDRSGVFTNIIPVLYLLLLFFDVGCLLSIPPDLPAIMRITIIFTLWFLRLQFLELYFLRSVRQSSSWLL